MRRLTDCLINVDLFSGWSPLNAQIINTTSILDTEDGMFWFFPLIFPKIMSPWDKINIRMLFYPWVMYQPMVLNIRQRF